jgi:membrane protein
VGEFLRFGKYEATYGSVGGAIAMLLWMDLSVVLLCGAEINAVIEHKSEDGKRAGAKRLADSGATGTKTEELRPVEPAGSFAQGVESGRGLAAGRRRVAAGLAALIAAAVWLRRRQI